MRAIVNPIVRAIAAFVVLWPAGVWAQTPTPAAPPSTASPRLITYRGLQLGMDVTAGRQGETALYFGAAGNNGMLGVRFSALDESDAVPCSAGVMYEHMFSKDRARITPVAGASFSRVFSCADDSDGVRPTPNARSVGTFSAGVRIPMFAGHRVVGALKVMAFSQKQFGRDSSTDVTSRGVTVGFVVGRR